LGEIVVWKSPWLQLAYLRMYKYLGRGSLLIQRLQGF